MTALEAQELAKRLRDALEPFAKEAHNWSPEENGGKVFDDQLLLSGTAIMVGDLRCAREAHREAAAFLEHPVPLKERSDFIAGYDAGSHDAKLEAAEHPVRAALLAARPPLASVEGADEATAIIREMVRLADMGFEASIREPQESGNYAVYKRAKRYLALAQSGRSSAEPVAAFDKAIGLTGVYIAYANDAIRQGPLVLAESARDAFASLRSDIVREKLRALNPGMGAEDLTDAQRAYVAALSPSGIDLGGEVESREDFEDRLANEAHELQKGLRRRAVAAEARLATAEKALRDIVAFCDDPEGSEKSKSLALGLARLLPAAREALASLSNAVREMGDE